MTAPASARPLGARQALKDFGWFYTLFATLASAPSLLSLLQAVFERRLVDALQWIVDGYNQIVAWAAAYLEPVLAPIVSWVNEAFDVNYALHAHWRPVFVLCMLYVMSFVRVARRETSEDIPPILYAAAWGAILTFIALAGALNVGIIPLYSGWYAQARIAAFAVGTIAIGAVLVDLNAEEAADETGKSEFLRMAREALTCIAMGAAAFGVAAALSLYPPLAQAAGVVTLAAFVFLLGVLFLSDGLLRPNRVSAVGKVRMGLTMLGGFATAVLIVLADMVLRALGAS
jgi:hypothetical protein